MASGQYVLAFEKAFNHTRYGASSIEIGFQNTNKFHSVRTTSWKVMDTFNEMPLEAYTLPSSDCKWLVVYDPSIIDHEAPSPVAIEKPVSAAERVFSIVELRLMILDYLDLSALCRLSTDHGLRTTIQKHQLLKTAGRDGLSPDYYVRVGMLRFMAKNLQGGCGREGAMAVGPQLRAHYYR